MMIITWIGAGVVQILACATDMYAIDQSFSKRKYALVFGAALLPFGFIPSFRHLRIILVFGECVACMQPHVYAHIAYDMQTLR